MAGRTPNPCIACNRYVKWEAMLHRSLEIGADYIATGHYAGIVRLANGRYAIRNAVTAKKDQTYALYSLTQEQLAHTLMPVGAYTKEEIVDELNNGIISGKYEGIVADTFLKHYDEIMEKAKQKADMALVTHQKLQRNYNQVYTSLS